MSACASTRVWTALLLVFLGSSCSTALDQPTLQEEINLRLEVMRAALRGTHKDPSGYFISNSDFGVHFTIDGIRQSIPLVAVNIEVRMVDMIAEVVLEQIFANPYNLTVVDCEYAFPMDNRAVLKDLIVTIGDRKIVGQVEERTKARELYEEALAAGESAFLVQQETNMLDVFTCSVGNLNPNDTTKVQLTYLMNIDDEGYRQADKSEGDEYAFRLVIPMAVAPRYTPIHSDPTRGSYDMGQAIQLRGLLSIEGSVTTSSPLLNISSLTHNDFLSEFGSDHLGKFSMVATSLDGDLVVIIATKDKYRTRTFYQDLPDGNRAMVVRYRPNMDKLLAQDTKKKIAKDVEDEYIFVIDRSGSMEGADMRDAAQALALFTSALPEGSRFNIIGFGSTYETLFPEVTGTPFTDATKAVAMRHCELVQADLGGTEILAPVQYIGKMPKSDGRRNVIVLTDGQVFNTAEVLSEIKSQNRVNGTKYFSVGIGQGASAALVKGIAENGEGESEFVVPGERIQAKVMRQMERMTRPSITKIQLKPPQGSSTVLGPFPEIHKELSYYSPAVFHLIFKADPSLPLTFHITSELPSGDPIIETFELGPGHAIPSNSFLHSSIDSLVAKAAITQLEEKEPMDVSRIVNISKQYNVASQHASFLAVEIKDKVRAVAGGVKKTQLRGAYNSPIHLSRQGLFMSGASFLMAGDSRSSPPLIAADSAVYSSAPIPMKAARIFSMRSAPEVATTDVASSMRASGVANSLPEAQSCTLAEESNSLHISLISQQRIAGGWDMDEKVIGTIGLTHEIVLQTLPTSIPGVTPEIWLTALVLAALQLKSAEYIDEWRIASTKALRWIKNSIDASYAQILLDAAIAEIN